jgi:curli biogenesis system outer membrane secretion channel CsgG
MASKFLLVLALLCVAELSLITTVVSRDTPVPSATSKAVLQTGILQASSTIGTYICRHHTSTFIINLPYSDIYVYMFYTCVAETNETDLNYVKNNTIN